MGFGRLAPTRCSLRFCAISFALVFLQTSSGRAATRIALGPDWHRSPSIDSDFDGVADSLEFAIARRFAPQLRYHGQIDPRNSYQSDHNSYNRVESFFPTSVPFFNYQITTGNYFRAEKNPDNHSPKVQIDKGEPAILNLGAIRNDPTDGVADIGGVSLKFGGLLGNECSGFHIENQDGRCSQAPSQLTASNPDCPLPVFSVRGPLLYTDINPPLDIGDLYCDKEIREWFGGSLDQAFADSTGAFAPSLAEFPPQMAGNAIVTNSNAALYFWLQPLTDTDEYQIQYWVFYAYDSAVSGTGGHRADWEHTTYKVKVPSRDLAKGEIEEGYYHGHGNIFPPIRVSKDDLHLVDDDGVVTALGTHPVVYVACGKHASYPRPGILWQYAEFVVRVQDDFFAGNGVWFDSWTEMDLVNLGTIEHPMVDWLLYGGHWGPDGLIGESATGPATKGCRIESPGSYRDFQTWATERVCDYNSPEIGLGFSIGFCLDLFENSSPGAPLYSQDLSKAPAFMDAIYPMADAGPDQVRECSLGSATVELDGSGSTDWNSSPKTADDITQYKWSCEGVSLGITKHLQAVFPLGIHLVMLSVRDRTGLTDTDTVMVAVVDTTPPQIRASASPDSLWPPNHRLRRVNLQIVTADDCDASPTVRITSATSDEPELTSGTGHTIGDIQVSGFDPESTGPHVLLRAERAGGNAGRVYTLILQATDSSGNSGYDTVQVHVPHSSTKGLRDRSEVPAPSGLTWTPEGRARRLSWRPASQTDPASYAIFASPNREGKFSHVASVVDTTYLDRCVDSDRWYMAAAIDPLGEVSSLDGPIHTQLLPVEHPTPLERRFRIGPNPSISEVRVELAGPAERVTRVSIIDVRGRVVRRLKLVDGAEGVRRTSWDLRNDAGQRVASGVYIIRATESRGGGAYTSMTRRVVVLR